MASTSSTMTRKTNGSTTRSRAELRQPAEVTVDEEDDTDRSNTTSTTQQQSLLFHTQEEVEDDVEGSLPHQHNTANHQGSALDEGEEDEEEYEEDYDDEEEEDELLPDFSLNQSYPFIPLGIGPLPFQNLVTNVTSHNGGTTNTNATSNSGSVTVATTATSTSTDPATASLFPSSMNNAPTVPYYLLPKSYVNQSHFINQPMLANYLPKSTRIELDRRIETTTRFVIQQEPNEIQRKSYKNENRCLLPNPLVICPREREARRLPRIMHGAVTVKLVNGEGNELPPTVEQSLVTHDNSLTKPLDEHATASFSLKLQCTSEGNHFRLLFNIVYFTEDSQKTEEKLLSLPFVVYSNRKKSTAKASNENYPVVLDMKPSNGPTTTETEIWIKGKGFTDPVSVTVGDKQAIIMETYDNLIVATAPPRFDLLTDTTVSVYVSNKNGRDLLQAEQKLSFVYCTNHNTVSGTPSGAQNGHVLSTHNTSVHIMPAQVMSASNSTLPMSIPVSFNTS